MTSCCDDYGKCTQGYGCPIRPDDWTRANIKNEFDANFMLAQTKPEIEMFEPSGFLTTMEWLGKTVAPFLIGVLVSGLATASYFLRG